MDDIVVVGRINTNGIIYRYDIRPYAWGPFVPPMPEDDPQYDRSISVKVRVQNSSNRSSAEEAAKRLEQALVNLELKLINGGSQSTTILSYNVTADSLVTAFYNTSFTVTDQIYNNNGVGAAQYGTGSAGSNLDEINFSAIMGSGGYGSPNYTNDEGMTALILHELAHLSETGYNFLQTSFNTWNSDNTQDHSSQGNFYSTNYATNVEAFANDIMVAYAGMVGADISTVAGNVIPLGVQNAVSPVTILNNNHN